MSNFPERPRDVLLQSGEGRRQAMDQMMWQVPGLSLTAQSFLMTFALGSSTAAARSVSGLLAFVASLATLQLLLKHRFLELKWAHWLENAAGDGDWRAMHAPDDRDLMAWGVDGSHPWHAPPSERAGPLRARLHRLRSGLVRLRSVDVWIATLLVFGLADLGAALYGLGLLLFV